MRIATETQSATWRGVTLCLSALRADHNDGKAGLLLDGILCLNALRADHNIRANRMITIHHLCLSALRADHNRSRCRAARRSDTLSQRTACRSQRRYGSRIPLIRRFVSAHRVQIATGDMYITFTNGSLCLSAPRADRNLFREGDLRLSIALSQRTACRSQRQMCTKHRVRICGMRCKSVDSFSQHEDLLRADYFPELFCYQSSLRCH